MDENLKHLSKRAKKLLLLLRTRFHASTDIDTAWLHSPDIEQAMGIDSHTVYTLAYELRKYDYVVISDQVQNRTMVLKLRISQEVLSAAGQLTLSHRAKKLFTPLRNWIGGFILGVAVTVAGFYVIDYLQTTDSKTSDYDNANTSEIADHP